MRPGASTAQREVVRAKKPEVCLECAVVQELVHLLERHHNKRFTRLMDKHLPHWRATMIATNKPQGKPCPY